MEQTGCQHRETRQSKDNTMMLHSKLHSISINYTSVKLGSGLEQNAAVVIKGM